MIPLLTWPAAGIAASRRSSATLAPAEYTGWNRRARAAEPISARDGCEPRKDLRKLSKSKLRVAAHSDAARLGQIAAGLPKARGLAPRNNLSHPPQQPRRFVIESMCVLPRPKKTRV